MTGPCKLLSLVALLAAGCGEVREPVKSAAGPPPAAATPQPRVEIPLEVKSWDETRRLIAAQRGKVVVQDLWSTWCAPCMREFPNLVALQRAHPKDVACISFNLDFSGAADETPESCREKVHEFLDQQRAVFPNLISRDPADEVFQRLDLGSIPAVLVYGRDGELVKRFDNDEGLYGEEGFTYRDQIVPLVERLLGDKPGTQKKRQSQSGVKPPHSKARLSEA